jgi:hypothetical protein
LQSQPTGGMLEDFNDQHVVEMNAYVDSIAENPELLGKTNIIMRDFIVKYPETVRCILRLNLTKNNIAKKNIAMFTLNTGEI